MEVTVFCTPHDRLSPCELDLGRTKFCNVNVGFAEKDAAQFRFAKGSKQVRTPTTDNVELDHDGVVVDPCNVDIAADSSHGSSCN